MTTSIPSAVKDQLDLIHSDQLKRSELIPRERLQELYRLFRDRYGPEKLAAMDGEELLNAIHARGNHESLVYWLEFKNDTEFPTPSFGSISGGSSHKFGLFRRKETEQWVTGSGIKEKVLSIPDAIALARKHRDQFVAGARILEEFTGNTDDASYLKLQNDLNQYAPDTSRLAWGHKYFHLLFPEKLDDYHNQKYQRHHLLKLLQLPPSEDGLYVCAGRYMQLTKEFGWPINHLSFALNSRDGDPIRYWRVGTRIGEDNKKSIWPAMNAGKYVAIGWPALGDLRHLPEDSRRQAIQEQIEKSYGSTKSVSVKKAIEILHFLSTMAERDVVIAADGGTVLGVGRISGSYDYDESEPHEAPHRRRVEWHNTDRWSLPQSHEGLQTTVSKIRRPENRLALEEKLIQPASPVTNLMSSPLRTEESLQPEDRQIQRKYWVEKTHVRGRQSREVGELSLGKVLWSPQKDKRGADIYRFMREVSPGDVILHLTDNEAFTGISTAASRAKDFNGVPDTEWGTGPSYLVQLDNFQSLSPPLSRSILFNEPFKQRLIDILDSGHSNLFFNREPSLNQGAYLTPAPPQLVSVLNDAYQEIAGKPLLSNQFTSAKPRDTKDPAISDSSFDMDWLVGFTFWERSLLEEVLEVLRSGGPQVILAGPPGTGKTWVARAVARHLTNGDVSRVKLIQFHPTYGYEQFIEGLQPVVDDQNRINFKPVPGVLLKLSDKIDSRSPLRVLIIDEMNRANLPRVFGELLYLMEYREESVDLLLREGFQLSRKISIIGTMNTADRSIRAIDVALRRRFEIFECPPSAQILERYYAAAGHNLEVENLIEGFELLNADLQSRLDRHHTIGHSFFMQPTFTNAHLKNVWNRKIFPLIEEYFFDESDVAAEFSLIKYWPNARST